jgi:hypothetical protein
MIETLCIGHQAAADSRESFRRKTERTGTQPGEMSLIGEASPIRGLAQRLAPAHDQLPC